MIVNHATEGPLTLTACATINETRENPVPDSAFVAFYIDRCHKIRLVSISADPASKEQRLLTEYCKHLDAVFKPYHTPTVALPQTDKGGTSSCMIDLDTNEYLFWLASREG